MGIFDSLYIDCPCGAEVEFQSKADEDKWCRRFDLSNCPPAIAGDLIGDSEKCAKCGTVVTLRGSVTLLAEFTPPQSSGGSEHE